MRSIVIPRKRCARFQGESQAPDVRPCSFAAISHRLPCISCQPLPLSRLIDGSHFMISLSLMIRFISFIIVELMHTSPSTVSVRLVAATRECPYPLCGSENHCGNSSCWHNGQMQSFHLDLDEYQTLFSPSVTILLWSIISSIHTQKLVAVASRVARAGEQLAGLSQVHICRPY